MLKKNNEINANLISITMQTDALQASA